jgi:lysozyme
MAMNRTAVASLVLSASALVGLALHEGFRSNAYDDGVGIQTIGFGSTAGVKTGDKITVERGLILLAKDVADHEKGLRACLGNTKLHQYEWDALTSWAFNVGVGNACRSTLVVKAKAGEYSAMCAELLRWNRAGGRVLAGLTKRREAEKRMCDGLA